MRGFRHCNWHFNEIYVRINGEMKYLWHAVDHEGELLESFGAKTRNKAATLRFMKKTLKRHGSLKVMTTDSLRASQAAMFDLGCEPAQETGRYANNREKTHIRHSEDESGHCCASGK